MNQYDFTLHFKLADSQVNPCIYEDILFEAGCDDAVLGVGQKGLLGLNFIRSSERVVDAIYSAIDNVKSVLADAQLYYISPDVVSLPEIASILNCSRQNVLKLKNSHLATFPFPINTNGKSSLWHLAPVLQWYQSRNVAVDTSLLEVAEFALYFNLETQNRYLNSDSLIQLKARALVS